MSPDWQLPLGRVGWVGGVGVAGGVFEQGGKGRRKGLKRGNLERRLRMKLFKKKTKVKLLISLYFYSGQGPLDPPRDRVSPWLPLSQQAAPLAGQAGAAGIPADRGGPGRLLCVSCGLWLHLSASVSLSFCLPLFRQLSIFCWLYTQAEKRNCLTGILTGCRPPTLFLYG